MGVDNPGGSPDGRWVRSADLVGAATVAEHLGVPVTSLEGLVDAGDLVAPVARLSDDVADWVWVQHEVDNGFEKGLMTAKEVAELAGYTSPTVVWDLVKKGNMPPPVRQVGRVKLYSRSEVVEYLATRRRRQ